VDTDLARATEAAQGAWRWGDIRNCAGEWMRLSSPYPAGHAEIGCELMGTHRRTGGEHRSRRTSKSADRSDRDGAATAAASCRSGHLERYTGGGGAGAGG